MPAFERQQSRTQSNYLIRAATSDRTTSQPARMHHPILAQQQSLGNQAVQRMLRSGTIQAKLTINQPGDEYEQEAERVADAVMRMPDPGATKDAAISGQYQDIRIQRMCAECKEELHRQPIGEEIRETEETSDQTAQLAPDIEANINALKGGGQPLPRSVRAFFEPRFGYDFSQVRVHTGARAAESARAVNARAYTVGSDMVFGIGQYQLGTAYGQRLLAHELTHVMQQVGDMHLQRVEDWQMEARATMSSIRMQANDLIRSFRGNPEGLAINLLDRSGDWEGAQITYHVFSQTFSERIALLYAMARQLDETRIHQLGQNPYRSGVILSLARELRIAGAISQAERIISIAISPQHAHLLGETATSSPAVQAGLARHGTQLQSIAGASGSVVYDEYSIVIDVMPPNLLPEAYLTEMTMDLNAAVRDQEFDRINIFRRNQIDRPRGGPAVGDIYDINIWGPDNGSVILVERTPTHFIFQTVTTSRTGTHPEFGSREFGFERLENNAVRFYTRGVSRSANEIVGIIGAQFQRRGWTSMLQGIGNTLQRRGGRVRPNSFSYWIRRG